MTDNPFVMIVRRLQGERPGMGSELVAPDRTGELFAAAALSPAIAISQTVLIPDVSFWEGEIDFEQMKAAGASGVIIRAGQRLWPDSRFKEYWQKAKAVGLPRGSYWFYDSREDPKKQAALWWSLIKDEPGELVHAADLEESYGGPYGKPAHFETFINEFRWLSKLPTERVPIYTGYFWWIERVGAALEFKSTPLWLAWYSGMEVVRIPAPWGMDDLLFWQWTSSGDGQKYGVSSLEIDLNWYCCNLEHFNNRFKLNEQPPEEAHVIQWYKVNTAKLNIRKGPGTSYLDIGDLFQDEKIETDALIGGWLNITKIIRANGTTETPAQASWCSNAYCIKIGDPEAPTQPALVHTITTYSDGSVKVDGNPVP